MHAWQARKVQFPPTAQASVSILNTPMIELPVHYEELYTFSLSLDAVGDYKEYVFPKRTFVSVRPY
jgi:hypothetical protein